ncbi:MAG: M48 family metallopeptidase [Candidatus Promineifilaceae bacterium]|jgi:predicted metal-dependent hydrolase
MRRQSIQHGRTVIEYELVRSRRRTVGITVHPDGRMTVRAPMNARTADVQAFVQKKGGWIVKKQRMFAEAPPAPQPPCFVSGEEHLFLGRAYALDVRRGKKGRVELVDGQFVLFSPAGDSTERREKLMREWYREQAQVIFARRLEVCYPRAAALGIPFPEVKIRLMKSRWGSCASSKGSILLNLRLIQTAETCIDYVILHELAHFKVRYHNADFYALMDKLLPDWRARREDLNGTAVQ